MSSSKEIINLNVGGKKFSTSKQTLSWIPDTFFTALLSGRIPSLLDENGAYFIDRDPTVFTQILGYLRTGNIMLSGEENLIQLKHEAEYYGISPLVKRLTLCEELKHSACGDLFFYGLLPALRKDSCNLEGINRIESVATSRNHSRNSSVDSRFLNFGQSRGLAQGAGHSRNASWDSRIPRLDWSINKSSEKVRVVKAHLQCIAVAYAHTTVVYRQRETGGWLPIFTSSTLDDEIDKLAINYRTNALCCMIAVSSGSSIHLWQISDDFSPSKLGPFEFQGHADDLFFIGNHLVALRKAPVGTIGVWHCTTKHWQTQSAVSVTCWDYAGSFLLLGSASGTICYIDMQKFPLRMKDNDLLVSELYKDPESDSISSISVYLTPKTNLSGNWIEIAYGTVSGVVRVIVQHPETVGHGPSLFQTFTVHRSPICKVRLSEKHLVSVCSDGGHVRTWSVTRFRGMVSTQPGPIPVASFHTLTLDNGLWDNGPFGEQDDDQIFLQRVVPDSDLLYVRLASNGKRICVIKSVDGSSISCSCLYECESVTRSSQRPRRLLLTGHESGTVQMWDLSTALDPKEAAYTGPGGPDSAELLRLVESCDLVTSGTSTPVMPGPGHAVRVRLSQLSPHNNEENVFV
ncbi:BTB/POZ domain-containing protein KCTD3-like [Artemia franciscana]|uniref:BTB/POZ domain-containing protein KCTD3-like n=1 Tax=Artemia franciscana TaxID=6661 RepID=UPI0032DA3171